MNWSRQTVNTYLNRLIEKGLVGVEEINKKDIQILSCVSRDEYAIDRAGSILNKYYGSLSHMVAGFVKNGKVSDTDLDELEKLIRELRKRGANKMKVLLKEFLEISAIGTLMILIVIALRVFALKR